MTVEKLRQSEPFFTNWFVESKVAEGKNSKIFKLVRTDNGEEEYMCLKTLKFPSSERELSKVIESGRYTNIDEYLSELEAKVCINTEKMLQLKNNGNIVRIEDYTVIKENSCFYICLLMELLTPLSDYLKADCIEPEEVIKIGWDLCNALEGFRQEGIMHRNIKPDNIYVDAMGNYKLGDFGISDLGEQNLSPGGYTAPELYKDIPFDTSSDIYSLGVVLYKLLNNNRGPFLPPFPTPISFNDRETANIRRLRGDLFPTPSNADYNLARIIFKATAFKPEDRYESPFLLRRDFEIYIQNAENEASVVAPATTHHVGTEKPRAPRADGAKSVTQADKEVFNEVFDDSDDDFDEEEKSDKKWLFIVMALVVVLALIIGLVVKSSSDRNEETTTEENTTQTTVEITETTTQVTTTEETTTEETTTEETTTEETTTEETTTEETTTEETTTEETTTEETTTEETTTEETTTEETTAPEPTTEPVLVGSVNTAGSQNELGKYYINMQNYALLQTFESTGGEKIVVEISDDLGESPQITGKVYVYMMYNGVSIQKIAPACSLVEGDNNTHLLNITIHDEEFFYEPDTYQYYLCLEEGSIESDTSVLLPLQMKL